LVFAAGGFEAEFIKFENFQNNSVNSKILVILIQTTDNKKPPLVLPLAV
jgi:hypothetical protein